jgi:hypothetical protein
MTPITLPRAVVEQALEALENSSPDNARPECVFLDKHQEAITALKAALAQQEEGRMEFNVKMTVCHTCGSTNGAHSHDCPVAKAALAQQEQDWEDLYRKEKARADMWRDKYESIAGPDERVYTQQEQATVKESLPVGQEEPEGGWQSAPSPQVTQRSADMPVSEYRRGVNDGFKLGLREGRIKAEDEMREQPEQEPVAWIQPDHLQKARQAPFLCRVEPTKRMSDFVPIYTHPPRREWVSLTEEEREQATGWSVEHIEAALKERNT